MTREQDRLGRFFVRATKPEILVAIFTATGFLSATALMVIIDTLVILGASRPCNQEGAIIIGVHILVAGATAVKWFYDCVLGEDD